ncbi:MAG: hypothetical protein L6R37_006314 [Teloschistes peruensis]|nr:MAG: hypothetical protein L6R37_006314 [Teloschistes peruensis]
MDPLTRLEKDYHSFADVFSKKKFDELPERRHYDHKIELLEGIYPPSGPLILILLGTLRKSLSLLSSRGPSWFEIPARSATLARRQGRQARGKLSEYLHESAELQAVPL